MKKGDEIYFSHRGHVLRGTVVRVKKNGIITASVKGHDEDMWCSCGAEWFDISKSSLRNPP